jgi:hypothetical protein
MSREGTTKNKLTTNFRPAEELLLKNALDAEGKLQGNGRLIIQQPRSPKGRKRLVFEGWIKEEGSGILSLGAGMRTTCVVDADGVLAVSRNSESLRAVEKSSSDRQRQKERKLFSLGD